MSVKFEKIGSTRSLSEEIRKRIKAEILNNNLLPGDKLPTEIEFREELPKTNVGKVAKKDLKAEVMKSVSPKEVVI